MKHNQHSPGTRSTQEMVRLLERSLLQCPKCRQMWLITQPQRGRSYTCKSCGCSFDPNAA